MDVRVKRVYERAERSDVTERAWPSSNCRSQVTLDANHGSSRAG
jgi:hypothetical protein